MKRDRGRGEGRAAIHRALPRLETGTNTNLVKLREIQQQVLQLGWNSPGQQPCREGPGAPGGKGREGTAAEVSC